MDGTSWNAWVVLDKDNRTFFGEVSHPDEGQDHVRVELKHVSKYPDLVLTEPSLTTSYLGIAWRWAQKMAAQRRVAAGLSLSRTERLGGCDDVGGG